MANQPRTTYGGQAVIEGVMMRGRTNMAVAVRAPNSRIVTHTEPLPAKIYTGPVSRIPFVRGVVMLWDTLGLGMKALMFSADVAMEGEQAQMSRSVKWTTAATAIVFGIGLFLLIPMFLASLTEPVVESSVLVNVIEGLVRLAVLVAYVGLIGLMPDIRRVYEYHGAEHMTIHAHEHDAPLEPSSISRFPPEHPRCGTAFLLQVVAISIVVFAMLGTPDLVLRTASRILLTPVIAGIAYEMLKLGAKYYGNPLVTAIVIPGLLLQRLTTRQPDDSQIEVAVAAFNELRRIEEAESVVTEVSAPGDEARQASPG